MPAQVQGAQRTALSLTFHPYPHPLAAEEEGLVLLENQKYLPVEEQLKVPPAGGLPVPV